MATAAKSPEPLVNPLAAHCGTPELAPTHRPHAGLGWGAGCRLDPKVQLQVAALGLGFRVWGLGIVVAVVSALHRGPSDRV